MCAYLKDICTHDFKDERVKLLSKACGASAFFSFKAHMRLAYALIVV